MLFCGACAASSSCAVWGFSGCWSFAQLGPGAKIVGYMVEIRGWALWVGLPNTKNNVYQQSFLQIQKGEQLFHSPYWTKVLPNKANESAHPLPSNAWSARLCWTAKWKRLKTYEMSLQLGPSTVLTPQEPLPSAVSVGTVPGWAFWDILRLLAARSSMQLLYIIELI